MGGVLTIEDIERRHAPHWVLINNPRTDEDCRVLAGEVVTTSNNGDDLHRKATELDLDDIAVRYLGPWPEDMVFILGVRSPSGPRRAPS